MTLTHTHIHVLQGDRRDPTRTTTLRGRWARDIRRRFNVITQLVRRAVGEEDLFGLRPTVFQATPGRRRFNFPRSQDKVTAFMQWLQRMQREQLITVGEISQVGESVDAVWSNKYVFDSYKRGVIRARYEMRRAGMDVPTIQQTGGIDISMSTPFHLDRLGLLYTRVYSDLKGITSAMDTQISRVLTDGLAQGDNPRLLARKLVATINGRGVGDLGLTDTLGRFIPARRRAEMLARTEVIRAHHQAMVQEYENWALEGVTVKAEWMTAGDQRVCPRCAALEGERFTLEEIRNKIPLHPQCRCIALPYETREQQRVTQLGFQ